MPTLPPRWRPNDEAELVQAMADAVLEENHYTDVKRSVGDTASARKETARDMASFAIDGGTLVIGVDEDKETRALSPSPQPLAGLAERLEQVATTAVDPPLFVVTHLIASATDPTVGYVVVDVPPSPAAPHMVDNVYFGRGDKTKVRLSDAEVLRFHSHREAEESIAYRLLDEEVERDPVDRGLQKSGRLYVVAYPLRARREVARDLVRARGNYDSQVLFRLARDVDRRLADDVREFAPTPGRAGHTLRRADGTAFATEAASGPGRTFHKATDNTDETDLLDIEFREDAGIRVLMGRMTDTWRRSQEPVEVIADGLAVAYAMRVVLWASEVSSIVGYHGPWVFGLHAHGLRGRVSSVAVDNWMHSDMQTYNNDEYRRVTSAQRDEMTKAPGEVAYRLVGGLIRGLGTDDRYRKALIPPDN